MRQFHTRTFLICSGCPVANCSIVNLLSNPKCLNPALPLLIYTTSRCGLPFHSCCGLLAFMLHNFSCRMDIYGRNCPSHKMPFFWLQENREHRPETAPSDRAVKPHTSGEAPVLSKILVLSLCLITEHFHRGLMALENRF